MLANPPLGTTEKYVAFFIIPIFRFCWDHKMLYNRKMTGMVRQLKTWETSAMPEATRVSRP